MTSHVITSEKFAHLYTIALGLQAEKSSIAPDITCAPPGTGILVVKGALRVRGLLCLVTLYIFNAINGAGHWDGPHCIWEPEP